jgi:hypothetical protein
MPVLAVSGRNAIIRGWRQSPVALLQPRQLLFFGQTCASLDKLSDKQRDPRVNECTA